MWFALPSSSGTRTLSFLPVSRRTCVKTRLLPATLAYSLADTLPRGESGFSTSMEVLSAGLAAALREEVHGRADLEQARIAALLAGQIRVRCGRRCRGCRTRPNGSNLDKRQARVAGLGLLNG